MKNNKNNETVKTNETALVATKADVNGMVASDTLNLANIHNAALMDECMKLQAAQESVVTAMSESSREIATVLYRVSATKLYEKDGFKSVKAFAEDIGLCVSSGMISQYITAGKVYSDTNAPDNLKRLPVTTVGAMGGVINDAKAYGELIAGVLDGTVNVSTQAKAKQYNADNAPKKADGKGKGKGKDSNNALTGTVIDDSTLFHVWEYGEKSYKTFEDGREYLDRLEVVESQIKASYGDVTEVIDLPDVTVGDRLNKRKLYIRANGNYTLVAFKPYTDADKQIEQERAAKAAMKSLLMKLMNGEPLTDEEKQAAVNALAGADA